MGAFPLSWSPDGSYFAFLLIREYSLELWVADVETASARKITDGGVNNTYYGSPFSWTRSGDALLVQMVPEERGDAPARSLVPAGPVIQENTGESRPARTFQDLLQDTLFWDSFRIGLLWPIVQHVEKLSGVSYSDDPEPMRIVADRPIVAQSARNRFAGVVTRIQRDKVAAVVEIQAGPHRLVSLMTSEALDELDDPIAIFHRGLPAHLRIDGGFLRFHHRQRPAVVAPEHVVNKTDALVVGHAGDFVFPVARLIQRPARTAQIDIDQVMAGLGFRVIVGIGPGAAGGAYFGQLRAQRLQFGIEPGFEQCQLPRACARRRDAPARRTGAKGDPPSGRSTHLGPEGAAQVAVRRSSGRSPSVATGPDPSAATGAGPSGAGRSDTSRASFGMCGAGRERPGGATIATDSGTSAGRSGRTVAATTSAVGRSGGGAGPGRAVAVAGLLLGDYFFLPPHEAGSPMSEPVRTAIGLYAMNAALIVLLFWHLHSRLQEREDELRKMRGEVRDNRIDITATPTTPPGR